MLIFVESYIYFRVIYLLENYHRLYFSTVESYVYYEFLKLYFLKSFKVMFISIRTFYTAVDFIFIRKLYLL